MNIRYPDFKKQETELYDKIRELSEEFDRLNKAGRDTTDAFQRLGAILEEFLLFRRQESKKKKRCQSE
ncbi:hypothetical protein SPSIL_013930 [Sporomusa silvacetica DSM 10669]|uniref:Spo0E like sporulation regulatory protein n=1 Tax=Sporomusa silvacetica DSM 10669 TaxID=1123289 RepID=A0ABZ3IHX1_9FIRM|nr:hypothetical protein [Sporomusa silvacetica]OZC23854.1 hypothetical protein SPSIL_00870 [Sporomusa silvacetica DSM 10669]